MGLAQDADDPSDLLQYPTQAQGTSSPVQLHSRQLPLPEGQDGLRSRPGYWRPYHPVRKSQRRLQVLAHMESKGWYSTAVEPVCKDHLRDQ